MAGHVHPNNEAPAGETPTASVDLASPHQLQCMEIIGGNQAARMAIDAPGLDIWLDSRPLAGNVGGDIHYFSACGSGRVTRLAIADVSGHGPSMDDIAKALRALMRKHINLLDQTHFAQALNREFGERAQDDYFATVLLATYFSPTDHLIICNGGHPRPVWFSRRLDRWQFLDPGTPDKGPSIRQEKTKYRLAPVANLPLGVIEPTDYHQFAVKLEPDDLVVFYTDALIEAANAQNRQLGEAGLLRVVSQLQPCEPRDFAELLIARVDQWRDGVQREDDQTVIVMHHNGSDAPKMTVGQAAKTMAKVFGLMRV